MRALRQPVRVESTGMTGFGPREFEVTFASPSTASREEEPCAMVPDVVHTSPYYEVQVGAWCGMHAINNYKGGPYCNEDDCRRACSQVVRLLSQAGGGDVEARSQHLHPETGWLSIVLSTLWDKVSWTSM